MNLKAADKSEPHLTAAGVAAIAVALAVFWVLVWRAYSMGADFGYLDDVLVARIAYGVFCHAQESWGIELPFLSKLTVFLLVGSLGFVPTLFLSLSRSNESIGLRVRWILVVAAPPPCAILAFVFWLGISDAEASVESIPLSSISPTVLELAKQQHNTSWSLVLTPTLIWSGIILIGAFLRPKSSIGAGTPADSHEAL